MQRFILQQILSWNDKNKYPHSQTTVTLLNSLVNSYGSENPHISSASKIPPRSDHAYIPQVNSELWTNQQTKKRIFFGKAIEFRTQRARIINDGNHRLPFPFPLSFPFPVSLIPFDLFFFSLPTTFIICIVSTVCTSFLVHRLGPPFQLANDRLHLPFLRGGGRLFYFSSLPPTSEKPRFWFFSSLSSSLSSSSSSSSSSSKGRIPYLLRNTS